MKPHALSFQMADGVRIAAEATGQSNHPPVMLAHGGGQTRHAWGGTARALAEAGWYALSYDHRGHGESGWSPDGDYALHKFADDLTAIAGQFEQRPVLVGASLGGLSAMLAEGELSPGSLGAVVLVDITPRMNREGAMAIMDFMGSQMREGFASLDEAADTIARYTGRPRRSDLSGLAKNLRLGDDGRYRWHWDPNFLKLREDHRTSPDRLVEAARRLEVPVLLVRGGMSDLVTPELAQDFLREVPHAAYVDVEDARHMVAGDRNDIFTRAVVEQLARWRAEGRL